MWLQSTPSPMSCVTIAAGNGYLLMGGTAALLVFSWGRPWVGCWGSACFELSKVLKIQPLASNVIALYQVRINTEIKGSDNGKVRD